LLLYLPKIILKANKSYKFIKLKIKKKKIYIYIYIYNITK